MKITKVVGIDIGNYRIKISYIVKGELKDVFVETLPDNIVKDGMVQYWASTVGMSSSPCRRAASTCVSSICRA